MAYANISRTGTNGIAERFAAVLRTLQAGRAKRALFRQTVRELNALSTRELNDLGIDRQMIRRIATEAAYGR